MFLLLLKKHIIVSNIDSIIKVKLLLYTSKYTSIAFKEAYCRY